LENVQGENEKIFNLQGVRRGYMFAATAFKTLEPGDTLLEPALA
jgi:hypothetical protein